MSQQTTLEGAWGIKRTRPASVKRPQRNAVLPITRKRNGGRRQQPHKTCIFNVLPIELIVNIVLWIDPFMDESNDARTFAQTCRAALEVAQIAWTAQRNALRGVPAEDRTYDARRRIYGYAKKTKPEENPESSKEKPERRVVRRKQVATESQEKRVETGILLGPSHIKISVFEPIKFVKLYRLRARQFDLRILSVQCNYNTAFCAPRHITTLDITIGRKAEPYNIVELFPRLTRLKIKQRNVSKPDAKWLADHMQEFVRGLYSPTVRHLTIDVHNLGLQIRLLRCYSANPLNFLAVHKPRSDKFIQANTVKLVGITSYTRDVRVTECRHLVLNECRQGENIYKLLSRPLQIESVDLSLDHKWDMGHNSIVTFLNKISKNTNVRKITLNHRTFATNSRVAEIRAAAKVSSLRELVIRSDLTYLYEKSSLVMDALLSALYKCPIERLELPRPRAVYSSKLDGIRELCRTKNCKLVLY